MPQPAPYDAAPPQGPAYHRLMELGGRSRWWFLLGVVLVALTFVVAQTLGAFVIVAGLVLGGLDADTAFDRVSGVGEVTPSFLALVNLGWAATIPAVLLVVWLLHGLRPGWAGSVVGRLRWGWMLVCFGLSLVALVATLVVSALLPAQGGGAEVSGELNSFTSTTRDFLLVVLLMTPLQAAGEEYAFRGYLAQGFGSVLSAWPRVALVLSVLGPATLFALAHGAQDPPIFLDRLAFGLVAGVVVLLTGGLEAGIAMHVLNNLLAFGLALAFGDMTSALNPTGGSWWSIPATLTQSLVFLGLVVWVARRKGIVTHAQAAGATGPSGELVAPRGRV